MYCSNCGEIMNDNQAICLKCGVKTRQENFYCYNCGGKINPGAEVCLKCGVSVKKRKSGDLNGQNKATMIIVCFFLGGLGIHNFMMGEKKKGIVKLVLCMFGISSILALIDLIRIATDSYVVDPDKFI